MIREEVKIKNSHAHLNSLKQQIDEASKELTAISQRKSECGLEDKRIDKARKQLAIDSAQLEDSKIKHNASVAQDLIGLENKANQVSSQRTKLDIDIQLFVNQKKESESYLEILKRDIAEHEKDSYILHKSILDSKEQSDDLDEFLKEKKLELEKVLNDIKGGRTELGKLHTDIDSQSIKYNRMIRRFTLDREEAKAGAEKPLKDLEFKQKVFNKRYKNFVILAKRVEKVFKNKFPNIPLDIETDINIDLEK